MQRCELCGNEYDKAFTISQAGKNHVFDSFECAIQVLAPTCAHCRCRIIGHGIEDKGVFIAARTAPSPRASPAFATALAEIDAR